MGTPQKEDDLNCRVKEFRFRPEELCEMHSYLQRDLCDLTGVDMAQAVAYDFNALVSELPMRFRSFNEALIAGDGRAIADWSQDTDPEHVKAWVKVVSEAVARPGQSLQCEDTRKRAASAILAIRQYFGFASRLTLRDQNFQSQAEEALEKFKVRATRPDECIVDDDLLAEVGLAVFGDPRYASDEDKYRETREHGGGPIFRPEDLFDPDLNVPFMHGPGAVAERNVHTKAEKQVVIEAERAAAFAALPLDPWYGRPPMSMNIDAKLCGTASDGKLRFKWTSPALQEWSCFEYGPGSTGDLPSRVITVPKDFRGPRVIAATCTWKTYVSGGFDTLLRQFLQKRSCLRNALHLNDQDVNKELARQASMTLRIATLDFSDASDLIHQKLVRQILKHRQDLLCVYEALRAGRVTIKHPSGCEELLTITTYLTMGERPTFPTESMVILIVLVVIIIHYRNERGLDVGRRITWRYVAWIVYTYQLVVFGDDTLCLRNLVVYLLGHLGDYGLLPNPSKCCYRGFFREACGGDYWMGQDVTPLRPRRLPGASEQSLSGHLQYVSNFAAKGMWRAAIYLYDRICSRAVVPPVLPSSIACAGCVSSDLLYELADRSAKYVKKKLRPRDPDYQRPFLRVFREKITYDKPNHDDGHYWSALAFGQSEEFLGYPVGVAVRPTLVDTRGVEARVISQACINELLH